MPKRTPNEGPFKGHFEHTHLVEADLSVGDLEDGVSVGLVLLDALVRLLALLRQLHSGHRHGRGLCLRGVDTAEGKEERGLWVTGERLLSSTGENSDGDDV